MIKCFTFGKEEREKQNIIEGVCDLGSIAVSQRGEIFG
jgi:hypothetical protein